MQEVKLQRDQKRQMVYLPDFAKYLLEQQLEAFQEAAYRIIREQQVPMLKYFSESELLPLANATNLELLQAMADNDLIAYTRKSLERWKANQLPNVERNQVIVDDITLITRSRRLTFLDFIPAYTSNPFHIIELIKEIDTYFHDYTSTAFNVFISLLDSRLNDQVKKLEQSDRLYKQAQAITHIGSYTWDLNKNQLSWSEELYRIYGLDPTTDNISNDFIASFNHPEDAELIKANILVARTQQKPFDFYFRIILKDGFVKTLHALGELILDENGQVHQIFGTTQDVTERQNLINKLQQNEQLYRQVETMAQVGTWSWDILTNQVSWTDELYRIYDLEPNSEEINFERYLDLIHPDDKELVTQTVTLALETKKPYTFYHRIRPNQSKKTKILHAWGDVITNNQGKVIQLIGSAQDVTVQKATEKRLLENQNFIKKITDATPALITSYNIHTGRYSFLNEALKKLLDYEPEQVLETGVQFFIDLVHPDDLEKLMTENAGYMALANEQVHPDGEMVAEFQYRMKHRNGEYRWFHTFGTVFERNSQHQVEQILNISLDITERIKAEQVLLQRTKELQQSNTSLEEFAYIASHDLKEPLRKISLFVDRLYTLRGAYSEEERRYLEKIMNSSSRMNQMIEDILSLSLLSETNEIENIDLQELLDEVLFTFDHKIEQLKASLQTGTLPSVRAIPSQFRQLFQNLLSNALKFSHQNIPPVISISHSYLTPDEVSHYQLRPAARYFKLVFEDNGIGFDNSFQEKIFAIFQRLHHKYEYEGTGIGLAICKKIVNNHGGIIQASGQTNKGAVFTIILPQ